MEKVKNSILILFFIGLTFACEQELDSEGVAKGTIRFPSIEIQGDNTVFIQAGSGYTDAGAKAFLGTDEITEQMLTESTVDANVAGVYVVNYEVSTVNELGTQSVATAVRTVVVAPSNPNTLVDLSGTYIRTNGAPAVWTKIRDGVYRNDNIGGVVPPSIAVLPVYVLHYDDNTVSVPEQPVPSGYGTLSATITLTADGYTCKVTNPYFGTGLRTFVKQ